MDGAGIGAPDHQLGRTDPQMQRSAEGSTAQHGNAPARLKAERGHALARHARRLDGSDGGAVVWVESVEGHMRDALLTILIFPGWKRPGKGQTRGA
jgi:hypothetical protein